MPPLEEEELEVEDPDELEEELLEELDDEVDELVLEPLLLLLELEVLEELEVELPELEDVELDAEEDTTGGGTAFSVTGPAPPPQADRMRRKRSSGYFMECAKERHQHSWSLGNHRDIRDRLGLPCDPPTPSTHTTGDIDRPDPALCATDQSPVPPPHHTAAEFDRRVRSDVKDTRGSATVEAG